MQSRIRGVRAAFTLVELLVVITIIGILLALATVAGWRALVTVRAATITFEVNALESAINAYKTKNSDFPPDMSDFNVFSAHLRRAYPRHREDVATWFTANPMTQDEALVFWLGGGLIDNPEYPLTGAGQPKKFYDFPAARLVDLNVNGRPSFVPAYASGQAPYIYFDSRTYGYSAPGNATIGYAFPYGTNTPTPTSVWESPTTFQIISAGMDGNYGALGGTAPSAAPFKFFPSGTGYTKQDRDNVTSFAEGTLESKLP